MIAKLAIFCFQALLALAHDIDLLSPREITLAAESLLLSDTPDPDGACELLSISATLEDAYAQALLGELYFYGDGTLVDKDFGLAWLTRSAMNGNGYGELRLAEVYLESETPDYPEIVRLLERSAPKGQFHSYAHLGMMSMLGIGVPKDLSKAHFYLNEAAKGEDPMALLYLGKMSYHGDGALQDYEKAFAYMRRAQKAGSREANAYLTIMQSHSK